MPVASY